MPEFRRIVCAVDFSETSERAFGYAIELAERMGARVDILHAYQLPTHALADGAVLPESDMEKQLVRDFERQLGERVERCRQRGVRAEHHLVRGRPHAEIVHFAHDVSADLIVVGTHGRTGLEHLLLGSVAERVVRTARVPVLTVRG